MQDLESQRVRSAVDRPGSNPRAGHRRDDRIAAAYTAIRPYLGSLSLAIGALLVALPVNLFVPEASLGRVFLVGVLISAISFGLWPSIFASLISAAIYDIFFMPPLYSLSVTSRQDIVDLICFLLIAVIVSALAARVRRYAVAADERAITAEKLADFSCRMAEAGTIEAAINVAAERLSAHLGLPVCIRAPGAASGGLTATSPSDPDPPAALMNMADRIWDDGETGEVIEGGWRIMRLRALDTAAGLLLAKLPAGSPDFTKQQRGLLDPLMVHIAMVIGQFRLRQRLLDVRLQKEAETLRATVLTSLSHDVRAPLASIIAGVSVLDLRWDDTAEAAKRDAVRTVWAEAERLDGYIGKLLDITRLDHEAVVPHIERIFIGEIVCSAIDQLGHVLGRHRVVLEIPDDLPLADADPVLLQQVLINLLDNAGKYSPEGGTIQVLAARRDAAVMLRIIDEGGGIGEAELPLLFNRFYRVRPRGRPVPGTGLGLAICEGFLRVMRGSITASNRTDRRGAVFSVFLPASVREQSGGVVP